MQTKDLNIILLNYSMTEYPSGNSIDINESDTFRIYIDGKEQIDGADNGNGDFIKVLVIINTASNVASIQVQKTIDFGIVTLTVTPFGTSDIYTATIDGTNILQSNKECESVDMKVSSKGLIKLNFEVDDFESEYYVVATQNVV